VHTDVKETTTTLIPINQSINQSIIDLHMYIQTNGVQMLNNRHLNYFRFQFWPHNSTLRTWFAAIKSTCTI